MDDTGGSMKRLFALGLAATLSGCVVDVTFDPFGSDFALRGDWTVNGEIPSVANCGVIDSVRVILWDEGTFFSYDDLTFPCAQGSFATGEIFAFGNYESQWQALDARGAVLTQGEREDLIVAPPTTDVGLRPVDFVLAATTGDLTVNLFWEDKDLTQSDCNIGVATYSWSLLDSSGQQYVGGSDELCATGLTFTELPFDIYSLYVEGAMSSGRKDWMVTCNGIDHAVTGNAFDCPITYVGP